MAGYSVDVVWHPVFELVCSLMTYARSYLHKVVDLGNAWRTDTKNKLPKGFSDQLGAAARLGEVEALLRFGQTLAWAWRCRRGGVGSVEDCLAWMRDLELGELYAIASRFAPPGTGVPADLGGIRDEALSLLETWHAGYFRHVDPAILTGLADEAAVQGKLVASRTAEQLVEDASGGAVLQLDSRFERVTLIPQYHARPWNIYEIYGDVVVLYYPAEAWPPEPGQPPARLLRLTKAINDANRLRILRLVVDGAHTFTEIADQIELSKATVHYHLVLLRAAGLLRVKTNLTKSHGDRYSLRREALRDLPVQLSSFINGPTVRPHPSSTEEGV